MKNEFPQSSNIVYLNHAAIGPIPKRCNDAIQAFAEESMRFGATHYPAWEEKERALRKKLAWLINADSGADIALLKNTSEALSLVAYGLDWHAGDNIVLAAREFPSNRIVWQSLQTRFGVELRLVHFDSYDDPEGQLLAAIDHNTRLLTTSSVHYDSGLVIDLNQLGQECQQRNVLFCVDAIQSLGAIPFDVKACNADFIMADGHKWLLSPEGVALFYCRPSLRNQLKLHQYGWRMLSDHNTFESLDWEASPTAKRFECGSLNNLGIHAMDASLSLFQELGIETIHKKIIKNILYLFDLIKDIDGVIVNTPMQKGRYAGIINFSHKAIDSRQLYNDLMRYGIICSLRGGGIRFSPHFYQDQTQLHYAINTLKQILKLADN